MVWPGAFVSFVKNLAQAHLKVRGYVLSLADHHEDTKRIVVWPGAFVPFVKNLAKRT